MDPTRRDALKTGLALAFLPVPLLLQPRREHLPATSGRGEIFPTYLSVVPTKVSEAPSSWDLAAIRLIAKFAVQNLDEQITDFVLMSDESSDLSKMSRWFENAVDVMPQVGDICRAADNEYVLSQAYVGFDVPENFDAYFLDGYIVPAIMSLTRNLAMQKNAKTLVCRELYVPSTGLGVACSRAFHNNLSLRTTMFYNELKLTIAIDGLFGYTKD